MKKKFILLAMMLLTLIGGVKLNVLNAQETETITFEPGSTSIVEAPSWNLYNRSYTQTIYTNENLGGKTGTITAIAYRQYSNGGNATSRTIDMYMANTDKNTFSSKTDFVSMTSSDLVYSGKIEFKQDGDWIYITLDKGFEYTGGNLLVSVNDKSGNFNSPAAQYYAGEVGSNRLLCYYKDGVPDYNPSSPSGTSKTMTKINNMKFVIASEEQEPSANFTVEIGAGATSYSYWVPFCDYFGHFMSQQIYTQDEIGNAGTINSVSFKVYSGSTYTRNLEVYMKNIDQDSFSGPSPSFITMSTSDKVFDGSVEVGTSGTWCTINFTTPFNYTGNHVVLCVYDKTGVGLSPYHYFYSTYTTGKTLYSSEDNVTPTSSATGTTTNSRNQIKFEFEGTPSIPASPVLTAEAANATSIALSWDAVSGADSYNVYQGSSQIATNITETTFVVESLETGTEYCFQVSAVNELGESEKSNEACETPAAIFTVEIGADQNPISSYYFPVYDYSSYSLSQQIYTKEEIEQGNCLITSVSFRVASGSATTRQYEVYLKNTEQSTFNGNSYITMTSSDKVFDGSVEVGAAGTWYTIDFTTPFNYTGNNIVICVYDKTSTALSNSYCHKFYTFPATGRGLYSQGSYAYNITSLTTGSMYSYVNQIRFDGKYPSPYVDISAESIDLGTVRLGEDFFTEKPFEPVEVTVKAYGGIAINAITTDDSFFKINEEIVGGGVEYTFHVDYNRSGNTGSHTGNIVVTYDTDQTVTIPLSAIAYEAADGDVIENPIEVTFNDENSFTHSATGMRDDYILPDEETDGNLKDAVYKFTLDTETVLTANVTGTNPIVAIYDEDFGEKDGPSSDNNNEGVGDNTPQAPLAETSFSYDFNNSSLEGWNTIDADNDGKTFQLSVASMWSGDFGVGGSKCVESTAIKDGNHNNYIVTSQKYGITETSTLTFSVRSYDSSNEHKYDVVVSTTNNTSGASFVTIYTETIDNINHSQKTIDLSEYAGQNVYIGFRHYELANVNNENDNLRRFFIDNIVLTDGSAKSRETANQIDGVLYNTGTYYLVAAAEDDFTLNLSTRELTAPEAATLISPDNDAREQNNPMLTWRLDKLAAEYKLLFGTTNPPTDVVVDWSAPATSYQTVDLANNTMYYWQVVSKNSKGETSSEVYSFATPLNKPTELTTSKTELYPGEEAIISWTGAEGATSYNVYTGSEKIAENITGTSYTLSGLARNMAGHSISVTANHAIGESSKSNNVFVKMTADSDVTITIKNTAGNPVSGATVRIFNGQDEYHRAIEEQTFTTDANGQINEGLLYLRDNQYYGDNYNYAIEVTKVPYKTIIDNIFRSSFNVPEYAKDITMEFFTPTNFVADSYNVYPEQEVVLTWDEVDHATSYNVYKRTHNGNYEYVYTKLNTEAIVGGTFSFDAPEYNMNGHYYSVEAVFAEGTSSKITLSDPVKVTGYGSISGTIANGSGALITLSGNDEFGNPQTYHTEDPIVADANGAFTIDNILAGSYKLAATKFDYKDLSAGVNVVYDDVAEVNDMMILRDAVPGNILGNVVVAEHSDDVKITWTGAYNNTTTYSIYRKNVKTDEIVNVAKDYVNSSNYTVNKSYIDEQYSELSDGTYKYALTTKAEQVVNNNTSFEDNEIPEGWRTHHTSSGNDRYDWQVGNTIYNDVAPYDGSYAAYVNNTSGSAAGGEYYMVSPLIDMTIASSTMMSFVYMAHYFSEGFTSFYNTLRVLVSTESEIGPWEEVWKNEEAAQSWTSVSLDLRDYIGKQIYIAFETNINWGRCTAVDKVVLPITNITSESLSVWSNEIRKGGIIFTNNDGNGDGKWETASNWSTGEVPANDGTAELVIEAAATISSDVNVKYLAIDGGSVTVNSGYKLVVTDELVNNDEHSLLIKDGAQLFHNSDNVKASFTMDISNPTDWTSENKDGWQFIASPFADASIANCFTNNSTYVYDLYRYNGSSEYEWDNHKDNTSSDQSWLYFNTGEGYLASYKDLTTATLYGTLNNAESYAWSLSYDMETPLANFHLLGNPFTFDMNWDNVNVTNVVDGFAVVNNEGGYTYSDNNNRTIPVGDGFFVIAIDENPSLTYNAVKRTRSEKLSSLNVIATSNAGKDNVVINLAGKSEGFNKLQNFNDAIATVYVTESGKNYGIYNCDADVQEVELNFNANYMGNYTISIEPNGKFEMVTLVDRFTGIETNMLVEDYHFTAMSNVNTNRFIVRMVNGQQTTDNSHFVYQSGEDLIIDAEGTVQIIDVMGRVLVSDDVESTNNRINVSGFQNGTYMVRVINGNEVKVEKVVIY